MVVSLVVVVIQGGELKIGHLEGSTYEDTMLPLPHRRYSMFAVQRWFILVTARSFYVSLIVSTLISKSYLCHHRETSGFRHHQVLQCKNTGSFRRMAIFIQLSDDIYIYILYVYIYI